jgi:hypothetical protein
MPTKLGSFTAMPVAVGGVLEDVQNSTWSSQAWTYQEGVRSRRRLVFTKDQVYFQCRAMHVLESVSFPLKEMHTSVQKMTKKTSIPQVFRRGSLSRSPEELAQHIAEFCGRTFFADIDVLNSFQGILRQFSKRNPPTWNLWGIPMLTKVARSIDLRLLHGLLWEGKRLQRRPLYPSWTWAGWVFPPQSGFSLHSDRPTRQEWIDTNISLRCCQLGVALPSQSMDWEYDYAEELATGICKVPFLKIRAHTVDLALNESATSVEVKDWSLGMQDCSWDLDRCISPDVARESRFKGLIVGRIYYEDDECYHWAMLVIKRRHGQTFFERHGLVRIPGFQDLADFNNFQSQVDSRSEDITLG